jgi:hypothetical protein
MVRLKQGQREGALLVLGVVILGFISLFHAEGPSRHDELLQDDCLHVNCIDGNLLKVKWGADGEPLGGQKPNVGDTWRTGPSFKGVDNHVDPKLPRCLGAECQQLNREKWGADGEPLDGHPPQNVGDTWSTGPSFKGVDNHVQPKLPTCLGAECQQLNREKWGADGEPLDGHTPENVGDTWSTGPSFKGVDNHVDPKLPPCLGAECQQLNREKWGADGEPLGGKKPNVGDTWSTGPSFKGVDNHVQPKLPRCLGAECQQLNREKWGADGEPLDGHTPENVGDTWRHGRTWKAVDEHKEFASPYACVGALCKQKALSLAQHSNVGDHLKSYGALGRPYKGTGKPKHVDSSLRADCLGGLGTACKVKRRCNYAYALSRSLSLSNSLSNTHTHTHTHTPDTHTHTHTHQKEFSFSHPLVPPGITH